MPSSLKPLLQLCTCLLTARYYLGFILKYFRSTSHFANELIYFMKTNNLWGNSDYVYDPYAGPKTKLSTLYSLIKNGAETESIYFLCDLEDSVDVAKLIDRIDIGFGDKVAFCNAPLAVDDEDIMAAFLQYCREFSKNLDVNIGVDVDVYAEVPRSFEALFRLESLHKVNLLFLSQLLLFDLMVLLFTADT
jgi:Suv3 C-terminal domain 1